MYVTSFRTSVYPDLRQRPMMVVLWFCFNFDVVLRGGEHNIYLLHHLDQKSSPFSFKVIINRYALILAILLFSGWLTVTSFLFFKYFFLLFFFVNWWYSIVMWFDSHLFCVLTVDFCFLVTVSLAKINLTVIIVYFKLITSHRNILPFIFPSSFYIFDFIIYILLYLSINKLL